MSRCETAVAPALLCTTLPGTCAVLGPAEGLLAWGTVATAASVVIACIELLAARARRGR